ncbi:MAG: flagellar biosynthetic protein FliO [Firmicutes bacterium]|nr:flagellar biosynthetic protein FliO [Bacillota bacterium]
MVALILYLSYVVSKRVGKGMAAIHNSQHMKVTDRIIVGQDKSIIIVQVGQKHYLVGVSAAGIQLLCEVSPEDMEVDFSVENQNGFPAFKDILTEKILKKK